MSLRRIAAYILLAEAFGAALWWGALLLRPELRVFFTARGAPDATLLAFGFPDGLLFIGAAAVCAYGFERKCVWAWPLLCVHAGAAGYAALYCWSLTALTGGDGWVGSVLMTPALIIPGGLAWLLRPKDAAAC